MPGALALGADTVDPAPATVQPLQVSGIHNLYRLTPDLLSGSAPESDSAFAALAQLGVKTLISVDGARPDVEAARRHGLRYVHLPHGYDGISPDLQLRLVQAAQWLPGPVYVHCHHGKHRGPATAAVICMANAGWTSAQATAWLAAAGTATNYVGLYQVVQRFEPPTPAQRQSSSPNFPETAPVSGLVEAMVGIDRRWEHLRAVRAAAFRPPAEHPDLVPAHEAMLLTELYREARRLTESRDRGPDFLVQLEAAENLAVQLRLELEEFAVSPTPERQLKLDALFNAAAQQCTSCHRAHRDAVPAKAAR
jgi:protein tyrosine phosphatase (PTP) superfamily phosphohydrolase (DUF442 family)